MRRPQIVRTHELPVSAEEVLTMTTTHETEVVPDEERELWQARCSCGWEGDWHAWSDEAVLDAEDHEHESI